MKIARVFPTKTSMSPIDEDAYFGLPDLFTPQYDEIHISVCFTWDLPKIKHLMLNWERYGKVKIGGPALDDPAKEFIPKLYLKEGCIFTSRGCPRNCPWCFVPKREGKIRELPIQEGNIIMDNNLLACSKSHIRKVIEMLKTQKAISFNQGLDSRLMKDWFVEDIRDLRIKDIWLAMDYESAEIPLRKAVNKLKKYFKRDKIRCYVLIGYYGDTIEKADGRLRKAWEIGTLPFAMRYRTSESQWQGTYLFSERKWNLFAREWIRPAIMKTKMRRLER